MLHRARILYPMHPVNHAHELAYGLEAWWLAHPLLNMGGTRWMDMISGGVGTFAGIAAPATATSGWSHSTRTGGSGALQFDGTDDYVDLPLRLWSTAPKAITMAEWIRADSTVSGIGLELGNNVPNATFRPNRTTAGTTDALVRSGGISVVLQWTGAIDFWHHYVLTAVEGSIARLYVDGVERDTEVLTGLFGQYGGSFGNKLGSNRNASSGFFDGAVDDVRVYTYAMSAAMVASLYANSLQGYPGLLHSLSVRHAGAWGAAGGSRPYMVPQAVNRSYRY